MASVSMLLKSRVSLTCFRACFIPGRAKELSATRYILLRIKGWMSFTCAARNIQEIPEDGVDKLRNASELKSD